MGIHKIVLAAAMLVLVALLPARAVAERPAGYPRSYDALIGRAQAEGGAVVFGNADSAHVRPVIAAFRQRYPGIAIHYHDLQSNEIYRRVVARSRAGQPSADLVWSSSMPLQAKLVNDRYAQAYASPEKPHLPPYAVWKNEAWGITAEPVVVAYNRRLLAAADVPTTHRRLEALLTRRRAALTGKVGTYDPAIAEVGYQFLREDFAATQDTRALLQAMAATRPRFFPGTDPMLDAISTGELAIGYNLVGSYALQRAARDPAIGVVLLTDYTLVTQRIALITREARHPASAKLFLDFLLSPAGQRALAAQHFPPIRTDVRALRTPPGQARTLQVGPQLLVHLDRLTRQRMLADWRAIFAQGREQ